MAQKYFRGDGVPKDDIQSFSLMKQAADWGSSDATAYLAPFYFEGIGTKVDPAMARKTVRQSAEMGSAIGAELLSETYLGGKFDGTFDRNKGLRWLAVSAKRGNPSALTEVGVLQLTGIGTERDLKSSKSAFQSAKENGIDGSMGDLVDLMLEVMDDPAKMQSAYDEFLKVRNDNLKASTFAALFQLSGKLPDSRNVKADELLKPSRDSGDVIAALLLRLQDADEHSK
jgi:TPR repeat protein